MPRKSPESEPSGSREFTNSESLLRTVLAPEEDNPVVFLENEEQRQKDQERLEVALERLEGHRRQIIELKHGLGPDRQTHSAEEISDIIGISVTRVNKLETSALKYLTYHLQGKVDENVKEKLKDLD